MPVSIEGIPGYFIVVGIHQLHSIEWQVGIAGVVGDNVVIGFIAEFGGRVSAILAQASDGEIGGDDGTTFEFETHET